MDGGDLHPVPLRAGSTDVAAPVDCGVAPVLQAKAVHAGLILVCEVNQTTKTSLQATALNSQAEPGSLAVRCPDPVPSSPRLRDVVSACGLGAQTPVDGLCNAQRTGGWFVRGCLRAGPLFPGLIFWLRGSKVANGNGKYPVAGVP